MLAWATQKEEREPTSAANFREQRRLAAVDNNFASSNADSPYAAVAAFASGMDNSSSKNQVDRIAEAWGMHEPEPYEEFFGGGGGGNDSAASSVKGGIEGRDGRYRRFRQDHDDARPAQTRRAAARGNIPPPQPIFVPGATEDVSQISPSLPSSPGAPGQPKRSKSIMQKFRRLREAPNAPDGRRL